MNNKIPWLPPYFGSYAEFLAALLNNPFLGSVNTHDKLYATHAPDILMANTSKNSEPDPSPWRLAILSIIATISLREAASAIQSSKVQSALNNSVDNAVSKFIDDYCGNGNTPPVPPHWGYELAATLAAEANKITNANTRKEILNVAGEIIERTYSAGRKKEIQTNLSLTEIDSLVESFEDNNECETNASELQDAVEELKTATGLFRLQLLARIRALKARRKELKCKPFFPQ